VDAADPLPGFDDRAPRDRYCDLILTGGVTSAIAYPAAIFALATAYRFNSIGGSSSGAGAAALAAAAEYRRRHGSSEGFRVLLERAAALAEQDANGHTGLRWLFQPGAQQERIFRALVPGIAKPDGKLVKLLSGLAAAYAASLASGIAIAVTVVWLASLCGGAQGWLAYLCAGLIGAVAALVLAVWGDVMLVVNHDYGICNGMESRADAPHPPLTEWLHDLIQEIAGRRKGDAPLSFSDLATAPGSPQETLGDLSKPDAGSIDLRMFTANVTHGRPYMMPQNEEDPDPPLYFRPSEMRRLFPAAVVEHLMARSGGRVYAAECIEPRRPSPSRWSRFWTRSMLGPELAPEDDDGLWNLPRKHLPIVVAARMSISFPVLFTAVPLWVRDAELNPPKYRRCMFSDGSLCSNFPIHLFDSPVPAWPTFGIALYEQTPPDEPAPPRLFSRDWWLPPEPPKKPGSAICLPRGEREGKRDRWNDFEEQVLPRNRLFGFVGALLWTTKDWNDRTLARLPGVRERVVQVGLSPGTGGLNILMTSNEIRELAEVGGDAARELLNSFSKPSNASGMAKGWDEHRWVRFNVLCNCLSRSLAGLTWSATRGRYAQPLREQIRRAVDEPPLEQDPESQLLAAQAAALEGVLDAMTRAERALAVPTTGRQPYTPSPRPELGVRPPL
jgi:hypothetical protein